MKTGFRFMLAVLLIWLGLLPGGCAQNMTPWYRDVKGHLPTLARGYGRIWVFNASETEGLEAIATPFDVDINGESKLILPWREYPTCAYIDRKPGPCRVTAEASAMRGKEGTSANLQMAAGTTRYLWLHSEVEFGRGMRLVITKVEADEGQRQLARCRYVGDSIPGFVKEKP